MPSQSASIQSYFLPQPCPTRSQNSTQVVGGSSSHITHSNIADLAITTENSFIPGDGFTAKEMASSPDTLPFTRPFIPPHGIPYKVIKLIDLVPVDEKITFKGRVVNVYAPPATSLRRAPSTAKDLVRCLVSDGDGLVTVRVWCGKFSYPLHIGSLITVWTTHIALSEHEGVSPSSVPLYTSIFPERDRTCHIQIHEDSPSKDSLCRKALFSANGEMEGLMTLASFAAGGWEMPDAKVLVCVKSVGARKTVTRRDSVPVTATTVHLFDHTTTAASPATLTLWDAAAASAKSWKPHHSTLLLTRPGLRAPHARAAGPIWLCITANTLVEVDPAGLRDADWLRGYAARLLRLLLHRQHCNPPFPRDALPSVGKVLRADTRILFTLADLDAYARRAGGKAVVGFVSVVLTEVNLVALWRRGGLCCAECECGAPLFANASSVTCSHCEKAGVPLSLNPSIMGPVIDETGCVGTGKLVFAPDAWTQLLGRDVEALLAENVDGLRALEARMLYVRVTLVVGWVGSTEEGWKGIGRLGVLGVRE